MADVYPYDRTTRERVALLLYRALPLVYRVQDQQPHGTGELEKFLKVLSAPLAAARQSVDELHANLFIDTCGDAALPLLAQIVGVELVFPDADTNRRDLRGTVSRRQRKGTRPMLQELGRDLTEQVIALVEGWRRLVVVQDLNTQRPDRPLPDVRPLVFGSSASGPLDAAHHLIDIRSISARTGRYHPRHLTHWVSVTRMFPLEDGTPAYTPDPADPAPDPTVPQSELAEWRYAFEPSGSPWALRQRPANDEDPVSTDRILADHFAARPGDFFGREGRFEIRVASLPAGVTVPATEPRDSARLLADLEIARGAPTIELLDRPLNGWQNGQFSLSLCVVEANTATNVPITSPPAAIDVRSTIQLGAGASVPSGTPTVSSTGLVLLRLQAVVGSGGFFPGATVAISGTRPVARRASSSGLASLGFLRGTLAVTLPPTWVFGSRWFYLTADGSVYDAQVDGEGNPDVPFSNDTGPRLADPAFLRVLGPGAAWPPLPRENALSKLTTMPPPPGRGPNILHGGRVLDSTGADVGGAVNCALVFAGRYFDAGVNRHELIGRLSWTGPNPSSARWEVLTTSGSSASIVTTPAGLATRLAELVDFRNDGPNRLVIAARFECGAANAVFTPSEVVWSSDDGDSVLLYLPELVTSAINGEAWPSTLANVSPVALAQSDGSTRDPNGALLRVAEGRVAPLRGPALHVRRRVKWRAIPQTPSPIPADLKFVTDPAALRLAERCLDVDVEGGRFSFYNEAPQAWPLGPLDPPVGFVRPPNVTVAFEAAYTAHLGAQPSPREVQLGELTPDPVETPFPTRIVSRSGVLSESRNPAIYGRPAEPPNPAVAGVPRYTSVNAAFAAIAAAPNDVEVVRIEDDATYPGETLSWPAGVDQLTLLSADARRPVLELVPGSASGASYDSLTLRGIALGGEIVVLPESGRVDIQFCTVTDDSSTIVATLAGGGTCSVLRSVTAGLSVVDGLLEVRDSVVDAGTGGTAIASTGPSVTLEGSTMVGLTQVPVLEASHCIFTAPVTVEDRFHGCVRFSAVAAGSTLPRRHEVVEGEDPRFLSLSRHHAGHVRLTEESPASITAGGEDGSELGAFGHLKATQRLEGYQRRLTESTPAGLVWALLRVD